jgi:hypothetical protein
MLHGLFRRSEAGGAAGSLRFLRTKMHLQTPFAALRSSGFTAECERVRMILRAMHKSFFETATMY